MIEYGRRDSLCMRRISTAQTGRQQHRGPDTRELEASAVPVAVTGGLQAGGARRVGVLECGPRVVRRDRFVTHDRNHLGCVR